MRLPKDEDMEVILYSAISFEWQLPKMFPCSQNSCKLHCLHCVFVASAQGMKEHLLAGEATTQDFWLFWKENARHNGMEDPGHHQISPYEDRFGCASDIALITWRADGIDVIGTQEGLEKRTEASKREAIVDVEAVQQEDPEEEKRRQKRAEQQNRRTKARLEGISPAASSAQSQERGQPTASEGGTKATKKKGSSPKGDRTKDQQGAIYSKCRSKTDSQPGSKPRRSGTPTHPKRTIKGSAGATNSSSEEEEAPKVISEIALSGSEHKPKSNEVDLSEDDPLPTGNQRRQKRADQSAGHSKKTRSKIPPIYGEVEEARRQQELTNREKPSHQKSGSGN